jgi:hypothetical protein
MAACSLGLRRPKAILTAVHAAALQNIARSGTKARGAVFERL